MKKNRPLARKSTNKVFTFNDLESRKTSSNTVLEANEELKNDEYFSSCENIALGNQTSTKLIECWAMDEEFFSLASQF